MKKMSQEEYLKAKIESCEKAEDGSVSSDELFDIGDDDSNLTASSDDRAPYWMFWTYWIGFPLICLYGYMYDHDWLISISWVFIAFMLGMVIAFDSLQIVYKGEENYQETTTFDLIWKVVIKKKKFTD